MHHFGQRWTHVLILCKLPEGQGRLSAGGVTHSLYKLCVNVAGDGVYGFGFCEENKALGGQFLAALLDAPTFGASGVRSILPVYALTQKAGPRVTVVALEGTGI